MTICKKVGNICKSGLVRVEEKKRKAVCRLGVEVWSLYQEKIFKSVFEQDRVKGLVAELDEYEREIRDIKEKMAIQKKQKEHRAALRRAGTDLKSKDPKVRKEAVRVLDGLLDKEAISYLNRALKDPDPEVCQKAAAALHKLVDCSVGKAVNSSQKNLYSGSNDAENELKKYYTGHNWYEINGKKVLGKKKALAMLEQLKNS